jgi:hypothetical protein
MMTYNRAITVLTRRATEFYGKTFEWLVDAMDNGFDENLTVTEAYKIYKMETNYVGS